MLLNSWPRPRHPLQRRGSVMGVLLPRYVQRRRSRYKYDAIKAKAQEVADMYRVRLTLIDHKGSGNNEYRLEKVKPRKETDIVRKKLKA